MSVIAVGYELLLCLFQCTVVLARNRRKTLSRVAKGGLF